VGKTKVTAQHRMRMAADPIRQQKIAEALDQILGITDREKELQHRDDLTEEERAELVAIEDAREAERQRNYQEERQRRLKLVGR
jgi:hypothetical protein